MLLVQSYHGRCEPGGVIYPIGLCYISTALKGHDVQVIDLNMYPSPLDELKRQIIHFAPRIVGISLRNIDTTQKRDPFYYFKTFQHTIHFIKDIRPSIKILVGGSGFSMFASEIMKRIPQIDFGVYQEGEESTRELIENLENPESVKGIYFRKGDRVEFTGHRPLPDMECLPIPRRQFIKPEDYDDPIYTNIGIQTKRGCTLRCAYCSYPQINGRHVRVRSTRQVCDEIESLGRKHGIRRFMFVDSVFNVPDSHAEEICKEIIRRDLDVEWSAFFNIGGFSKRLLKLAMRAGCRNFSFSPDAVTDKSLQALGKGITEKDISRVVRMLVKTDAVRVEFHLFCTPPGQTFKGVLKTLLFLFKVNILFRGRGVVHLGWIRIEPRTEIYELAKSEGIVSEQTDLLPETQEGLRELFYSCPKTRGYADSMFDAMLKLQEMVLPVAKYCLKINAGKKRPRIERDL